MSDVSTEPVADETGEAGSDEGQSRSTVVHVAAPLLALGATWVLRSALNQGYRAATGHKPPVASDPSVAWQRALLWAATTAASAAIVEVLIFRWANRR